MAVGRLFELEGLKIVCGGLSESSGTTTLSYDYESRVTGISYPGGATNSFTYNGLDTRTGKTDSGGTKSFLRDGTDVTSPVLRDGTAAFTPGISESRTGISTFYGQDQLGTNNLQSSVSQTVTNQKVFDAFGMQESSTGSSSSPFGFVGALGYQEDSDSGLMLLGHRYYDASIGRFLSRNPVKAGSNVYVYVRNNPLKRVDPVGLVQVPPAVWIYASVFANGFAGGFTGGFVGGLGGMPPYYAAGLGAAAGDLSNLGLPSGPVGKLQVKLHVAGTALGAAAGAIAGGAVSKAALRLYSVYKARLSEPPGDNGTGSGGTFDPPPSVGPGDGDIPPNLLPPSDGVSNGLPPEETVPTEVGGTANSIIDRIIDEDL